MPLTPEQIQLVIEIDNKVKQALSENKDDAQIIGVFTGKLVETFEFSLGIMRSAAFEDLRDCCFRYPGFFLFLRIIDKIIGRFASGEVSIQKVQEKIDQIKIKKQRNE